MVTPAHYYYIANFNWTNCNAHVYVPCGKHCFCLESNSFENIVSIVTVYHLWSVFSGCVSCLFFPFLANEVADDLRKLILEIYSEHLSPDGFVSDMSVCLYMCV